MAINIYENAKTKRRIEASKRFAGSTQLQAEIDNSSIGMAAFGQRLLKQIKLRNSKMAIVGVKLDSLNFSLIYDAEKPGEESL